MMLQPTGALEVARQREQRLEELNDTAEAARVHADALDALVEAISMLRVPVSRYEPHWRAVEDRLRKDAMLARKRVTLALDRVADVQRSIEARENWSPGRPRTSWQQTAEAIVSDDPERLRQRLEELGNE